MQQNLNATFEDYFPKRVSYILATKNHAERLDTFLDRCRSFKEPQDELIIMDGGSTDHTREVVQKYDDLVDVFVSEPDVHPVYCSVGLDGKPVKDPVHAVNKGILLARGKYIKTLGDDDVYHPLGMKKAIEILEAHPEIDLLICGGTRERFGRTSYVYIPPGTNYGNGIEDIFRYGEGCGTGHFFRRSAIAQAGLHPPNHFLPNGECVISADVEYVLRFIRHGAKVKFCRINVFHSPYSHFDYPESGFAEEKPETYWYRAARIYCSRSFYIKYIINKKLSRTRLLGYLRTLRKRLRRRLKNPKMKRWLGKKVTSAEMVWDGGFS